MQEGNVYHDICNLVLNRQSDVRGSKICHNVTENTVKTIKYNSYVPISRTCSITILFSGS